MSIPRIGEDNEMAVIWLRSKAPVKRTGADSFHAEILGRNYHGLSLQNCVSEPRDAFSCSRTSWEANL